MGCHFHWQAVASLDEAAAAPGRAADVLVNCCGLGAVQLLGDDQMTPVRGSLVLVRCEGVAHVYSDESMSGPALTYVVPKGGGVVACLGCAEPGVTSLDVEAAEAEALVRRCAELLPMLRGAPVLGSWAGLRPVRSRVRLEKDSSATGCVQGQTMVVHNYGHAF
jgi:D-amino-acid oxidase